MNTDYNRLSLEHWSVMRYYVHFQQQIPVESLNDRHSILRWTEWAWADLLSKLKVISTFFAWIRSLLQTTSIQVYAKIKSTALVPSYTSKIRNSTEAMGKLSVKLYVTCITRWNHYWKMA